MEIRQLTDPYPHAIITDVIPQSVYAQLKFPELQRRNNTRAGWICSKEKSATTNSSPAMTNGGESKKCLTQKNSFCSFVEPLEMS